MLASLLAVLPLLAPDLPELPVPTGREIALDGKVEEAEWNDAFTVKQGPIRLHLKRTGPWLAVGLAGDGAYRNEVMRFYSCDPAGVWITALYFGLGNPAVPPLLWRRGSRRQLAEAARVIGECPRACRARFRAEADGWSAEYLVRVSALGLGRADRRAMRGHVTVPMPGAETALLLLPQGSTDDLDPAGYARLVSPDGWGAQESWPPVAPAVSKEFDDHELLFRLYLEHERIASPETPEYVPISTAVRPRVMAKINRLRKQIEAARARNPELPAWSYFLLRLLHEANLYADARELLESIPEPLRRLNLFVNLAVEHYIDTEDWQAAIATCRANPRVSGMYDTLQMTEAGQRAAEEEAAAIELDARKPEKNPQVRIVTAKGEIICELFEDDAPHAVRNFMNLVIERNFYDGLRFHTVVGGTLAQAGDPRTRPGSDATTDGPGWTLRVDDCPRRPMRGYLTTVPGPQNAYHGSQFIIGLAPLLADTRKVTAFGRIVQGREVAESLEENDALLRIEVVRKRNHAYVADESRLR